MSENAQGSVRDTAYRFFSRLRLSEKRAAAVAVGIPINDDRTITDFDRNSEFLKAVIDAGKVPELATHINRVLGDRPAQDPSA